MHDIEMWEKYQWERRKDPGPLSSERTMNPCRLSNICSVTLRLDSDSQTSFASQTHSVALAGRCYLISSIISTLPIVVGLTLSNHRLPTSSSSLASCLVVALTSCRLLPPAQCRPFNEFQVPTSSFASFFMVTFTSCRPPTVAACCNVSIARLMSNYFPFLHA